MTWIDLRSDIEDMFDRLVVLMPDRNAIVSFAPESSADVVERVRSWKRRNRSRVVEYDAARYAANRDVRLAHARAYYAANRDAIRERRAS